jgi:hypothetical protein
MARTSCAGGAGKVGAPAAAVSAPAPAQDGTATPPVAPTNQQTPPGEWHDSLDAATLCSKHAGSPRTGITPPCVVYHHVGLGLLPPPLSLSLSLSLTHWHRTTGLFLIMSPSPQHQPTKCSTSGLKRVGCMRSSQDHGTRTRNSASSYGARVFDSNLHTRMPLVPTPARLKLLHVCDHQ